VAWWDAGYILTALLAFKRLVDVQKSSEVRFDLHVNYGLKWTDMDTLECSSIFPRPKFNVELQNNWSNFDGTLNHGRRIYFNSWPHDQKTTCAGGINSFIVNNEAVWHIKYYKIWIFLAAIQIIFRWHLATGLHTTEADSRWFSSTGPLEHMW
jgi:hypothetical protein